MSFKEIARLARRRMSIENYVEKLASKIIIDATRDEITEFFRINERFIQKLFTSPTSN